MIQAYKTFNITETFQSFFSLYCSSFPWGIFCLFERPARMAYYNFLGYGRWKCLAFI